MKAVVTVIGKDKVGIIADVAVTLKDMSINIVDISQTIMQDYFTMIMMVELDKTTFDIDQIQTKLTELGSTLGVEINIRNTDIFDAMHRI